MSGNAATLEFVDKPPSPGATTPTRAAPDLEMLWDLPAGGADDPTWVDVDFEALVRPRPAPVVDELPPPYADEPVRVVGAWVRRWVRRFFRTFGILIVIAMAAFLTCQHVVVPFLPAGAGAAAQAAEAPVGGVEDGR